MVRYFFLLIYFLIVEDYELPKSTSHIITLREKYPNAELLVVRIF